MTSDLLGGLAALNILKKDSDGNFQNTEETSTYGVKKSPLYMGAHFLFHGGVRDNGFKNLKNRLLNKIEPVFETQSKDVFNEVYQQEAFVSHFASVMNSHTNIVVVPLSKLDIWTKVQSFVDIGGSNGYVG